MRYQTSNFKDITRQVYKILLAMTLNSETQVDIDAETINSPGELSQISIEIARKHAEQLKQTASELYGHVKPLTVKCGKDSLISESLEYLLVAIEALDEFIRLLENHKVKKFVEIVWKHRKFLAIFAELGGMAILASIFIRSIEEYLNIREDDFQPALSRIQMCIKTVKEKLPATKKKVHEANELLKELLKASDAVNNDIQMKMNLFEHQVKAAENDIEEYKELLEIAGNKLGECQVKMKAKIWANRCYKTVCMGVMSGFLYSTVKGGTLSSPNAMGIGCIGVVFMFLPVGSKHKEVLLELQMQQEAREYLMNDIMRMEEQLKRMNKEYLEARNGKAAPDNFTYSLLQGTENAST